MAMPLLDPVYTPEEYLEMERAADYKSEFINGRIYAMAGTSADHNIIEGNVFNELKNQLRGRPCRVFISDLRVKVRETGMYTYPDIAVVCGERRFEDTGLDTLTNPTVLIEVLSPSTAHYDRGAKFSHYRRLESLQEYMMIAQDAVFIEHYVRQADGWFLSEYEDVNVTLVLPSVNCRIALRDIYENVDALKAAVTEN